MTFTRVDQVPPWGKEPVITEKKGEESESLLQ